MAPRRKPGIGFIFVTLFLDILGIGVLIPIVPGLVKSFAEHALAGGGDVLMQAARSDATKLDCAICMLDVAHTLERLADRTTNIAERVIFIATNVTEQLNA